MLNGKRKFILAIIATLISAALTVYFVREGTPALDAAAIAAVVVGSLWAFIGIEGGRDIVRTWRDPK